MKITLVNLKGLNQGFLDLTAPLTEKSAYKDSSQAKAWGSDFYLGELLFCPVFGSQVFSWRTAPKTQGGLIQNWLPNRKPYLRSSNLLAYWSPALGDPDLNQEHF